MSRVAGAYELVRRLGTGAMGEVWLGRHTVTGGVAAVKVLRESAGKRERVRRFFAREGRAVTRLQHPHIVPVFEVDEEYIASAFIDGADLARRLRTPMAADEAVRVTGQIAAALAHAHARGVVHRDVKPSNILLDGRQNAYLADFGLALLVDEQDAELSGARAGTPAFMAPEQLRGEAVGPAVDQHALARTLLAMLLGVSSPGPTAEALAQLPPETPEALREAIARAAADDATARFATVTAFAEALAQIELGAVSAAPRLAPEARARAAYAWAGGADRVERQAPDLARADYRLSHLVEMGLLPAAASGVLGRHALADVGFSVHGRESRLGPINESGAWARAAEVVVLLHGWSLPRASWNDVAAAVCRDNAQAIVITIDTLGHGDALFQPGRAGAREANLPAWLDSVRELLGALGASELPMVLAGHSMMGSTLLSRSDEQLGARVSRVVINPVWPENDALFRIKLRAQALLLLLTRPFPRLRHFIVRRLVERGRTTHDLAPELQQVAIDTFMRLDMRAAFWMVLSLARLRMAPGTHQHLLVIHGLVDPLARPEAAARGIAQLRLGGDQVQRLASASHFPQLELEPHPEWTARNVAEITHAVDQLLLSARQGTMLSTEVASTELGPSTTDPARAVTASGSASGSGAGTGEATDQPQQPAALAHARLRAQGQ